MMRQPIRVVGPALLLAACGSEPPPAETPVVPVRTYVVGSDVTGGSREYAGVIQAVQSAELGFEVPGRIEAFPVVEGQELRRGGLVARIEATDYVASRDAAAANRLAAEAEYQRYRSLYASDVVSLQELEVRRRNFEVADASFRTAQKALRDTELRAPFHGVVAMKLVPDFANVQAKEPVVLFEDNSSLKVAFDVPERDFALAESGLTLARRTERMRPMVALSSAPERRYPARFVEVATAADPVTRTFRVTLALARPEDVQMAPGMTARVTITLPASGAGAVALRIPAAGLGTDGDGSFVLKVVDGDTLTVERAPVETGAVVGGDVEILSGLASGDRIVLSAVRTLRPGTLVRLMDQ